MKKLLAYLYGVPCMNSSNRSSESKVNGIVDFRRIAHFNDRWRQVLAEADRIPHKHLLTLEAAISTSQTTEMQAKRLQLVLPRTLHTTYTTAQQAWLMDVSTLISLVRERQEV